MGADPVSIADRGVRGTVPDPTFSFALPPATTWRVGGSAIDVSGPVVMGILNLTPDSFSDGGHHAGLSDALRHAENLLSEGADLLDVGGESTRPGARPVDPARQRRRIIPFVREAARRWNAPISVDTRSAEVAAAALDAGARIVNDVSGLTHDPAMAPMVAGTDAGVILMHMRGTPATMTDLASYGDVVEEVADELRERLAAAVHSGIDPERIVVDPGLGFAKTADQTLRLVGSMGALNTLERPVLIGPSRKRFIGHVLDLPADQRAEGTVAACVLAYAGGARIFRVHDVGAVRRALLVAQAVVSAAAEGRP